MLDGCFAIFLEQKFPAEPEKSVWQEMSVSAKLNEITIRQHL